jgi:hypothetical protein
MSVEEWGEYIAYGGDEVKVARSYRVYNEMGELVSTGIEWEIIERKPGIDVEEEVRKARKRLDDKIRRIREEVEARRRKP